jgi:hypothetical protein
LTGCQGASAASTALCSDIIWACMKPILQRLCLLENFILHYIILHLPNIYKAKYKDFEK